MARQKKLDRGFYLYHYNAKQISVVNDSHRYSQSINTYTSLSTKVSAQVRISLE